MNRSTVVSRDRAPGFSLVELLMVVAILVILGGIFLPYFCKIRETECRARCSDNLRAIMEGLRQYTMLKEGAGKTAAHSYPSAVHDKKLGGYVAYTGADSVNPFGRDSAVRPNDVTASLFLLVRLNLVPIGRFICPSTWQTADPLTTANRVVSPEFRSNFTDGSHLSYSYASPFSQDPKYKMKDDSHVGDFAIVSDKNPGPPKKGEAMPTWDAPPFALARANSRNHGSVGQNVLYADGHVSWQTTAYCGVGDKGLRDNIFTALSPKPIDGPRRPPLESPGFCGSAYGPSWANDSYLVPTDGE